ncbi:periplasmic heavy metal sensor [Fundidesulfovibrio agrisoli]|uniref:periplasmic heavy metal sensor n=1 Tax=Fundidesulfovibrio agrisoli TaxID=2922717 RepID=UPI001FACB2A4|nr:periplasmic heavy metal sensor [Fundidesulfovibrio agrisoli]
MSKTSRYLQAVGGMSLAFLIGLSAMAAQDAATAPKAAPQAQAQAQTSAASAPAKPQTFAPGMPGWMMHLPAEQQETARKIWLTEGRTVLALKEMLKAKRHELNAMMAMPNADDKAVAALVKEVASQEEKLLGAEVALRRKLEKEGIPTWGRMDGMMDGMGGKEGCMSGMMDKMGGMMMGGKMDKMGQMGGMMGGMDHSSGHDAGQGGMGKPAAAAATPAAGHGAHNG